MIVVFTRPSGEPIGVTHSQVVTVVPNAGLPETCDLRLSSGGAALTVNGSFLATVQALTIDLNSDLLDALGRVVDFFE